MRILYVVHDFLPYVVAGTELSTYYLAKQISKRHDVHLFFNINKQQEPGHITKGHHDGLPFTAISNHLIRYNDYAPPLRMGYVAENFQALLAEFQPQIVHFQHILHLTPQLVRIVHEHKLPVIYTLRDFWLLCNQIGMCKHSGMLCYKNGSIKCGFCYMINLSDKLERLSRCFALKSGLKQIYWRLRPELKWMHYYFDGRFNECHEIFELTDLFICHSDFVRKMFIKHGLDGNKIIYTAMGMPKLNDIRKKQHIKKLQFGFMGGGRATGGLNVLLKAFDGITDARLHIFGNVSKALKAELMQGTDNPNVSFHGVVTGVAKEHALSQIDVFIVPSLFFETFSRVTHEAYQLGAPVIASDIGALAEYVIDGITGLQFKVGNHKDLRRKIQYLIDNPERVAEMRSRIPKVKSIEEHASEMENIYSGFLQAKTA